MLGARPRFHFQEIKMGHMDSSALLPRIKIEKRDYEQLDVLVGSTAKHQNGEVVDYLVGELVRAEIVEDGGLPGSIVTMGSRVTFRDEGTGAKRTVRLVFPSEKARHADGVSVMTPVGAALIGLSESQSIAYRGADGRTRIITVMEVWPVGARTE
jgi:regulator of nucleoside diphosphate kinase